MVKRYLRDNFITILKEFMLEAVSDPYEGRPYVTMFSRDPMPVHGTDYDTFDLEFCNDILLDELNRFQKVFVVTERIEVVIPGLNDYDMPEPAKLRITIPHKELDEFLYSAVDSSKMETEYKKNCESNREKRERESIIHNAKKLGIKPEDLE